MGFYKIAGIVVEYEPIYSLSIQRMEKYRCDKQKADIVLKITKEFCELKQKENSHLTLEQCEYIFAGLQFYRELIKYGGFVLHSSAVVVDNCAYLFSADSGVGKSTHTQLWQKYFGKNKALIINDDKPAIKVENGQCYVYGTPFSGKTDMNLDMRVPLKSICMLERGIENNIKQIEIKEALPLIFKQTILPKEKILLDGLFNLLEQVMIKIPIYKMKCNISTDAAKMAYNTMKG